MQKKPIVTKFELMLISTYISTARLNECTQRSVNSGYTKQTPFFLDVKWFLTRTTTCNLLGPSEPAIIYLKSAIYP